jgi:DNA polymerase-1
MRVLLIDADLLVYRFANVHQHAEAWDDETWSYRGDLAGAKRDFDRWVAWLKEFLKADETRLYLSDSKANWRHSIYPDYKGQRAAWQSLRASAAAGGLPPKPGPQRPVLYKPMRAWLVEERDAKQRPKLEGDDLLGIVATRSGSEERIIVSADKDLQTVPGALFNPDRPEDGVRQISMLEADRYHLLQTLMGDRTDNYPGCPGLGPVKAAKILEDDCSWAAVVKAYKKAQLTEDDALVQARVARVLRDGDYVKGEVKLWEPR